MKTPFHLRKRLIRKYVKLRKIFTLCKIGRTAYAKIVTTIFTYNLNDAINKNTNIKLI